MYKRAAKFILALAAMIALSSYLSSVSMSLVALIVAPQAVAGPGMLDSLVNVLFTIPSRGVLIAAPVCALLSILIAAAVVMSDLSNALGSQRARVIASTIVCTLPGIYVGRMAGESACHVGMHAQGINCDIGSWAGVLLFALTGALAGMIFAVIYKLKQ